MYNLNTQQVNHVHGSGLLSALGITQVEEGMAAFAELSALAAIAGAGYGVGTLINDYVLPDSWKRAIGNAEGAAVNWAEGLLP